MIDRIDRLCPFCGFNDVVLYFHNETEDSIYGLHFTASCRVCGHTGSSFVDHGLLHFILRVASKEHTEYFVDTYSRPWRWSPWKFGCFGLLKYAAMRFQVEQSWYAFCDEFSTFSFLRKDVDLVCKGYPLKPNLAEHRVIRPLVRAVLCSSGDLVSRVSYLQHCNGRVGQPLAS